MHEWMRFEQSTNLGFRRPYVVDVHGCYRCEDCDALLMRRKHKCGRSESRLARRELPPGTMDTTKITATLPNEVVADLRQLATDRHLTLSAALREAITTARFIHDEMRDGKLLIEKGNGDLRRIVFR